jgi:hypothetical protein
MARRHLDIPARARIDARPINEASTQMGVKGAHRGIGGELLGGYMPQPDGSMKAFGTKERGVGHSLGGGLDRWYRMNPQAAPRAAAPQNEPPAEVTAPAGTNRALANPLAPAATSAPVKGNGSLMATPAPPAPPAPEKAAPAREDGLSRWERLNPHAKKPKTGFA